MPADAAEIVRLAELCEAGTTPSRDLDALIAPLQGLQVVDEGHPLGRVCYDRGRRAVMLPRYTASLDAAMTLVPEDSFWELNAHSCAKVTVDVRYGSGDDRWLEQETLEANAATAALALAAASLRARAAQHDHEVG